MSRHDRNDSIRTDNVADYKPFLNADSIRTEMTTKDVRQNGENIYSRRAIEKKSKKNSEPDQP